MTFQQFDPRSIFESALDGNIAIQYFEDEAPSGSTNRSLIAAVAAKKTRVLAVNIETDANATYCTFKNGSSGTRMLNVACPAIAVGTKPPLPFNPAGWCETSVNTALCIDTATGPVTRISIVYIQYTP